MGRNEPFRLQPSAVDRKACECAQWDRRIMGSGWRGKQGSCYVEVVSLLELSMSHFPPPRAAALTIPSFRPVAPAPRTVVPALAPRAPARCVLSLSPSMLSFPDSQLSLQCANCGNSNATQATESASCCGTNDKGFVLFRLSSSVLSVDLPSCSTARRPAAALALLTAPARPGSALARVVTPRRPPSKPSPIHHPQCSTCNSLLRLRSVHPRLIPPSPPSVPTLAPSRHSPLHRLKLSKSRFEGEDAVFPL